MGIFSNPITSGLDLATAALNVIGTILKMMPDYDQKKRARYYEIREAYEQELKADISVRDDNLVCTLRDDLTVFVQSFEQDLNAKKEMKLL